ncbi:hypothetical protein [Xanthomarina sp. GH4-25]|uniref:hypothetical protein n=1 Tax=Xanthomarina sp. GH4-25 TaxID=3349335 RepID=UPI0026AE5F72
MKLIFAFIVMISISLNCLSQEKNNGQIINYKTGNPADWPKELDAVISAPNNHKILLENDQVRVLEVTLAPGEIEALHHHQWPSVLYIQEAGDFTDSDGDDRVHPGHARKMVAKMNDMVTKPIIMKILKVVMQVLQQMSKVQNQML